MVVPLFPPDNAIWIVLVNIDLCQDIASEYASIGKGNQQYLYEISVFSRSAV